VVFSKLFITEGRIHRSTLVGKKKPNWYNMLKKPS